MFNPVPPRDETEQGLSPNELAEQQSFARTHPDHVLLKLTCTQCGKLFRVKCNAVGEKVDCPACEHPHTIPDAFPGDSDSAAPWPVNRISLIVFCPRCKKKCLVKGEQAGKRIRCNDSSCRKIFRVPPIQKENRIALAICNLDNILIGSFSLSLAATVVVWVLLFSGHFSEPWQVAIRIDAMGSAKRLVAYRTNYIPAVVTSLVSAFLLAAFLIRKFMKILPKLQGV